MKALRIKLLQSKAHYGRPECVDNRMTYPLPPYSTVIGALHNACGYTTYHEMDLSIQGKYASMGQEMYTHNSLLNSLQDDRGILVYLENKDLLSAGYVEVARAQKPQGNSFAKNETIEILRQDYIEQYWALVEKKKALEQIKKESIDPQIKSLKAKEKDLKATLKKTEKNTKDYEAIKASLDQIKEEKKIEKEFKERRRREYEEPISHYRTLVKAPKYYEVLYGVELVLHLRAEEAVMEEVLACIHNLTAIGRSEDFVNQVTVDWVELKEPEKVFKAPVGYSGYMGKELCGADGDKPVLMAVDDVSNTEVGGTVYSLPKNYVIQDNKRIFQREKVLYLCQYAVRKGVNDGLPEEPSKRIFVDDEGFIVALR